MAPTKTFTPASTTIEITSSSKRENKLNIQWGWKNNKFNMKLYLGIVLKHATSKFHILGLVGLYIIQLLLWKGLSNIEYIHKEGPMC